MTAIPTALSALRFRGKAGPLACDVPVIASDACGLGALANGATVRAGDLAGLRTAVPAVCGDAPGGERAFAGGLRRFAA
jgi:hypothetical protein